MGTCVTRRGRLRERSDAIQTPGNCTATWIATALTRLAKTERQRFASLQQRISCNFSTRSGPAIILISHDVQTVRSTASRVMVLEGSQVAAERSDADFDKL